MSWLRGLLAWLAAIVTITMSTPESSNEVPNALHVTAGNISMTEDDKIDPNGYVLFCPCMGKG